MRKGIPDENRALSDSNGINWHQDAEVKPLGVTWLPNVDCFRFNFSITPHRPTEILTKCQVLYYIALRSIGPSGCNSDGNEDFNATFMVSENRESLQFSTERPTSRNRE